MQKRNLPSKAEAIWSRALHTNDINDMLGEVLHDNDRKNKRRRVLLVSRLPWFQRCGTKNMHLHFHETIYLEQREVIFIMKHKTLSCYRLKSTYFYTQPHCTVMAVTWSPLLAQHRQTLTPTHTHTHTRGHTSTHVRTHANAHARIHARSHRNTTHTHAHARTHTHARTRTLTHPNTHARINKHARQHTRTYIQSFLR